MRKPTNTVLSEMEGDPLFVTREWSTWRDTRAPDIRGCFTALQVPQGREIFSLLICTKMLTFIYVFIYLSHRMMRLQNDALVVGFFSMVGSLTRYLYSCEKKWDSAGQFPHSWAGLIYIREYGLKKDGKHTCVIFTVIT